MPGLSFTQMTQAKAEEIVKELQEAGQLRIEEAQSHRPGAGRPRPGEHREPRALVQREVTKQLESIGVDLTDLEARVEELARRVGIGVRRPAVDHGSRRPDDARQPAKKSTAKKVDGQEGRRRRRRRPRRPRPRSRRPRRPPAKKSTAKKAPAKKATGARRSHGQAAPARKAAAKKHGRSSSAPRRGPVTVRRRLDVELVRRGLAPSRAAAQAAIAEHRVTVGGCDRGQALPPRGAGRSGRACSGRRPGSSAAAARSSTPRSTDFGVDVAGAGRSTPARRPAASPTACCSGAPREVVAVDVGHGQLHPPLRDDPRVVVRERCNVRHLDAETSAARSTSSSPTCRSSR